MAETPLPRPGQEEGAEPSPVAARLAAVQRAIAEAAARSGRPPSAVRLVAVSKGAAAAAILEAFHAGQRDFGENRVQELAAKRAALPAGIAWHMIGHLQTNKAAKALRLASLIHSVSSERLLRLLAREAEAAGVRRGILLEFNVSGEPSKQGASIEDAPALADLACSLPALDLRGLMGMAPLEGGADAARRAFGALRRLRDSLEERLGKPLPELSMGMSGDFEAAIAEGSTMVRVGSAIFGGR